MTRGATAPTAFPEQGLYAITPEDLSAIDALLNAVSSAIAGGAAVIQYRCKNAAERRAGASPLLELCRKAGVPLIINDDVELAAQIGADGVHLGKDDGDIALSRRALGQHAIIGVSCYDSLERAMAAEQSGADYVAFGRFFPSRSKPHAPCAKPETLTEARRHIHLPIVAIGGITAANGANLLHAGAGLLAVIDGVFGSGDPKMAAARFQPLFRRG
ncbi:thiamine phosphate synthase [Methyloterricola oryzae]|uniref:thiamine phosphate synthase n=1 Tax=Methyloterricola oryzae TaxID=1495050 RepID=UPI0005EB247B|nr:thiamine phosphate synthase [Methyloterricola oryzae]